MEGKNHLLEKKKRTLWINFLVIFATWIPFVFISILSNSITLIAQMLMGGAQSLSVFLSLRTAQKSVKQQEILIKREVINARIMALVFFASFIVVSSIAIKRFFLPKDLEFYASMLGVLGNTVAVFVNLYQWRKNLKISKESFSPVMESQWTLFRIKTCTAFTAVVSILVYYLLPSSIIHRYVDPGFSIALAILILYSGISLIGKAKIVGEE